jgi:copper(I)-binding protein
MSHVTTGRGTLTCAALVVAVGLLAGCSDPTGNNALTTRNYNSADGVQADSALITVRDLLLVSNGQGATVVGAFGNNGNTADSVVTIAANGSDATVDTDGGSLQIPSGGALTFGSPTPPGGPQAFLTGTFAPGTNVPVQIVFADAKALTLQVPVLPHTGYYTAVPSPSPDTSPTAPPSTVTPSTVAATPAPTTATAPPAPTAAPSTTPSTTPIASTPAAPASAAPSVSP